MADLVEITTEWVTASGGGKVSVMYFLDSGGTINEQRNCVWGLWDGLKNVLDNGVTVNVASTGRVIDSATGGLISMWNDSAVLATAGIVSGECVADSTQGLIRWTTGTVFSGRMLRGRQFIPGISTAGLVSGNLSAGYQSNINTAAATFIGFGKGFVIWHRPQGGSGGGYATATAGTAWNELAVLRRRRA